MRKIGGLAILTCIGILVALLCSKYTHGQNARPASYHIKPFHNDRSLKGLTRIGLTVQPNIFFNDKLLDFEAAKTIQTSAELQLRVAGIPFTTESWYDFPGLPRDRTPTPEESRAAFGKSVHPRFFRHEIPTLIVEFDRSSEDQFEISVFLFETAHLERDPLMTANCMSWAGNGKKGREGKDSLADVTKAAIDDFCNAYLAANPKK